jgi:hypothetical protein
MATGTPSAPTAISVIPLGLTSGLVALQNQLVAAGAASAAAAAAAALTSTTQANNSAASAATSANRDLIMAVTLPGGAAEMTLDQDGRQIAIPLAAFGAPPSPVLPEDQLIVLRNGAPVTTSLAAAAPAMLVTLPGGYTEMEVDADGRRTSATTAPASPALANDASASLFAEVHATGVRIDNGAAFTGQVVTPIHDGSTFVADAAVVGGINQANIVADYIGARKVPVTIGASGFAWGASAFAGILRIMPFIGHSQNGGGPDNTSGTGGFLSTAAVDPGNALMPTFQDSYIHPNVIRRYYAGGTTDLRASTIFAGSSEPPICGFAKMLGQLEAARGSRIVTLYGNASHSGSYIQDILSNGDFEDACRFVRYGIDIARAAGLVPMPGPLVMLGHGNSERLSCDDYVALQAQLIDRYNAFIRRAFQFASHAPGLPLIVTPCAAEGPLMRTSAGARIYAPGVDGPALAAYRNWYLNRRKIIAAGAMYPFPVWTDQVHDSSPGMFRHGEVAAQAADVIMNGVQWNPVAPIAYFWSSPTVLNIRFARGGLVLDTTAVADMVDGNKGFVLWNKSTAAALAIASIAVTGGATDTITITLAAAPPSSDNYVDYGLWRDDTFTTGIISPGSPGGPRGNLRLGSGWASNAPGAITDSHWALPFRAPVSTAVLSDFRLSGRIA